MHFRCCQAIIQLLSNTGNKDWQNRRNMTKWYHPVISCPIASNKLLCLCLSPGPFRTYCTINTYLVLTNVVLDTGWSLVNLYDQIFIINFLICSCPYDICNLRSAGCQNQLYWCRAMILTKCWCQYEVRVPTGFGAYVS